MREVSLTLLYCDSSGSLISNGSCSSRHHTQCSCCCYSNLSSSLWFCRKNKQEKSLHFYCSLDRGLSISRLFSHKSFFGSCFSLHHPNPFSSSGSDYNEYFHTLSARKKSSLVWYKSRGGVVVRVFAKKSGAGTSTQKIKRLQPVVLCSVFA